MNKSTKTTIETYQGYEIRKSGKSLFKVMQDGKPAFFHRFVSVAAAKVAIDSKGRVMTAEEHAIMHPGYREWTNREITLEQYRNYRVNS